MPIPSLSTQGHITDPVKMADYLLGCFYVSQHSQSNVWLDKVQSLPYILMQSTSDGGMSPKKLAANTETALITLFNKWFEVARIKVVYEDAYKDTSMFNLIIYAELVHNSTLVNIEKSLYIKDSKLKKINDIINGISVDF